MLERARQAAAERLKQAADAGQKAAVAGAGKASETLQDPATHAKAKQAVVTAGQGVKGALDKINPGMLAGLVMKATSLQEQTNAHLQRAGSLYRIEGIEIGVSFPPSISFQIVRLGDLDPGVAAELGLSMGGEEAAVVE